MPRLRRWKKRKFSLLIPALTRWAKVCRASGAGRNANSPFSSQRSRAGLKYAAPPALERGRAGTARRKGGGRGIPAAAGRAGKPRPYAEERARCIVPLHGWELRAELACGEVFQGAKAAVEFGRRQAPQAVERAQKIPGRTVALARVAFETAGNQVAVGIASKAHPWHNVIEAVHVSGSAAETVKASAAFAIVNGFAERPGFQEIRGFKRRGRRLTRGPRGSGRAISARAESADLLG